MTTTSTIGSQTRTAPRGHAAGTLIARLIGGLMGLHRTDGHRLRGYRPERHYLRGPGPACRARNGLAAE